MIRSRSTSSTIATHFAHFLKFYYPELPPRRAFFLAQGSQRVVYTYSSPRLEEDLRHEATHALLRGSFGDLPLWLDEGLAEYFETDLAQPGAEHERIEHIADDLAAGWSPNLARLESLTDIRQMTPRDYREAWAWVHLFLNGSENGKPLLLGSLAELHEKAGKLSLAEKGATNERLLAHLKTLQSGPTHVEANADNRSVRLQDKPVEARGERLGTAWVLAAAPRVDRAVELGSKRPGIRVFLPNLDCEARS